MPSAHNADWNKFDKFPGFASLRTAWADLPVLTRTKLIWGLHWRICARWWCWNPDPQWNTGRIERPVFELRKCIDTYRYCQGLLAV